jgi:hypothetical protein
MSIEGRSFPVAYPLEVRSEFKLLNDAPSFELFLNEEELLEYLEICEFYRAQLSAYSRSRPDMFIDRLKRLIPIHKQLLETARQKAVAQAEATTTDVPISDGNADSRSGELKRSKIHTTETPSPTPASSRDTSVDQKLKRSVKS